jgi:hypothetical protein
MRGLGKPKQFPLARSQGLLIEDVDAEKVIFDEETKHAHCLTPLAAIVFGHCDGNTSPAELAGIASGRLGERTSEEEVQNALTQLRERGLLASPLPIEFSRRDVLHKSAALGAAAAAATLVFTVDPAVAQAAGTCTSIRCTLVDQCFGGTGCPIHQSCNRCTSGRCACHS